MACVPQPRHMMGGGDVSWMSQFLFLLCTSREERDRASGYRKRGPKPKRLLLQVTTVSEPPPTCLPHLHVSWPSLHLLTSPSIAECCGTRLSGFVSVGVGQRLRVDLEPGRSA